MDDSNGTWITVYVLLFIVAIAAIMISHFAGSAFLYDKIERSLCSTIGYLPLLGLGILTIWKPRLAEWGNEIFGLSRSKTPIRRIRQISALWIILAIVQTYRAWQWLLR